ncbi:hypothetical protein GCM10023213_19800 [Prosthecobacter algae]|uniref:DUF3850 domain-containing protein n=1 Tax=Prosthecobacter algae TaxID=1144682 RepID=A0ABP9P1Z2_9BACT
MNTHTLKTDPELFDAVEAGLKTFEIRFDDRGYQVGDILRLRRTKYSAAEMKTGKELAYDGREVLASVTKIVSGTEYGLHEGWVVMAIKEVIPETRSESFLIRKMLEMLDYTLADKDCGELILEVNFRGAEYYEENEEEGFTETYLGDMETMVSEEFSTTTEHLRYGSEPITRDDLRELRRRIAAAPENSGQE